MDECCESGRLRCSSARLERVRASMAEQGIDALFVRNLSDIAWLTGFEDVFDDEPAHRVLITGDGAYLHTDSRYSDACGRAADAARAAADADWSVETQPASASRWLMDHLRAIRPDASRNASPSSEGEGHGEGIVVAIEDTLPLREFRALESAAAESDVHAVFAETDSLVLALRARKDPSEISAMKKAQAITDAAFASTVEYIRAAFASKKPVTEREVQLHLEETMRRLGSVGLAFSSIVAAGVNGAAPHSIPGSRTLQRGDMVVMDFGARFGGYCADMTRVVSIGYPGEREAAAYAAIRRANEEVEALLRPGVTGRAAHDHAESVLAQCGFAGCMGHALGHGVGLDIHEQPVLAPRNEEPLAAGNVVTIEPGIYIPGEFGCRLEDFGVVCEDGFEVFTQSSHDIVIIECL